MVKGVNGKLIMFSHIETNHQFIPREYSYFLKLNKEMISSDPWNLEFSKCVKADVAIWLEKNMIDHITFIRTTQNSEFYLNFGYLEDALLFKMTWGW